MEVPISVSVHSHAHSHGESQSVASASSSESSEMQDLGRMQADYALKAANSDAPGCAECGMTMVRNGACYKCNDCGATSGCS